MWCGGALRTPPHHIKSVMESQRINLKWNLSMAEEPRKQESAPHVAVGVADRHMKEPKNHPVFLKSL